MRADAARRQRQRRQLVVAGGGALLVVVAVAIAVLVAVRPNQPTATGNGRNALSKLVALPESTLDAAPAPAPAQVPATLSGGQPLTENGRPKVLYVGAEYCPFCAMQRWALIGAMARFGTFTGLTPTTSSSTDVHPDTPTFSFHGSSYESDYLAFQAVETQDRAGKPLETLSGSNLALFQEFNPGGSIPWVTYGGLTATTGATVDPNSFDGKTYDQIIAGILDPGSDVGRTVVPAVDVITAQLCTLTKDQPANVCRAKSVRSASALLAK